MNVVIDMIDAIAAIALALRAVAELEGRVFRIRSADVYKRQPVTRLAEHLTEGQLMGNTW